LDKTMFTIRAEKAPNRRGVAAILEHLQGELIEFPEIRRQIENGQMQSLYWAGGDPFAEWPAGENSWVSKPELLIVQDLLPSAATEAAHFVLPGSAFAEKEGTFINAHGLAQTIQRSVRGPGESRPDGRILWELSGRRGLF